MLKGPRGPALGSEGRGKSRHRVEPGKSPDEALSVRCDGRDARFLGSRRHGAGWPDGAVCFWVRPSHMEVRWRARQAQRRQDVMWQVCAAPVEACGAQKFSIVRITPLLRRPFPSISRSPQTGAHLKKRSAHAGTRAKAADSLPKALLSHRSGCAWWNAITLL